MFYYYWIICYRKILIFKKRKNIWKVLSWNWMGLSQSPFLLPAFSSLTVTLKGSQLWNPSPHFYTVSFSFKTHRKKKRIKKLNICCETRGNARKTNKMNRNWVKRKIMEEHCFWWGLQYVCLSIKKLLRV